MSNQKEPASKKGRAVIIIAFGVLLAALAVCVALLLSKPRGNEQAEAETSERRAVLERGIVDESNAGDIMSDMAEQIREGMFECKMSTNWTFEDGGSASPNAYVANVENNLHALYFDVYNRSDNELLYSSPLLPVGSELKGFKLDKELPAGDYGATVMYTLVDENNEEVSTVGFNIAISVLN